MPNLPVAKFDPHGASPEDWARFHDYRVRLTAVHRSAQGNGIGRWIKSAMLLHVRENHPAMRWILTDNASSNGPMLNINIALGFRPYKLQSNFQIGIDDFAKAVDARR